MQNAKVAPAYTPGESHPSQSTRRMGHPAFLPHFHKDGCPFCVSSFILRSWLNFVCKCPMKWLKNWKTRTLLLFAIIGPGFITANVDNDAGGIYTYSSAGAHFGYQLLWSIIPITLALIVVQEMSARMGAVTGKGLSDLIREEYGLRIPFLMMAACVVVNFSNVI